MAIVKMLPSAPLVTSSSSTFSTITVLIITFFILSDRVFSSKTPKNNFLVPLLVNFHVKYLCVFAAPKYETRKSLTIVRGFSFFRSFAVGSRNFVVAKLKIDFSWDFVRHYLNDKLEENPAWSEAMNTSSFRRNINSQKTGSQFCCQKSFIKIELFTPQEIRN